MNVLHMKYAVEVARCGSINKAAEILMVGQPNISRAIKELESTVGASIFLRTAKGMRVTAEGEIFLRYANSILKQMDEIEEIFKKDTRPENGFSLRIRGAAYIYAAIAAVCADKKAPGFICAEADNRCVLQAVENGECRMGIVRTEKAKLKEMRALIAGKGLTAEFLADFKPCITVGKNNTSQEVKITPSEIYENEKPEDGIFISSSAARDEFLRQNPHAYMTAVPAPNLKQRGLKEFAAKDSPLFTDVVVRRKELRLSETEEEFLCEMRKICAKLF